MICADVLRTMVMWVMCERCAQAIASSSSTVGQGIVSGEMGMTGEESESAVGATVLGGVCGERVELIDLSKDEEAGRDFCTD